MDLAKLFSWEAAFTFVIGMLCGGAIFALFLSNFRNYIAERHMEDDPADWWKKGERPYDD